MSVIHASAVKFEKRGVLLIGPSASGKSSLAAHLIDRHDGQLIADDRVVLTAENNQLIAGAPASLSGLLELRGFGVVEMPTAAPCIISLAVNLVARQAVPRIAEADYVTFEGLKIPQLHLHGFDLATPMTIKQALVHLPQKGFAANGEYRAE